MTLDILHFIDNKGGNAAEIKESQRKRGLSEELVDEVIQMYTDWVKSASLSSLQVLLTDSATACPVDYDINMLRKKVNEVQKQVTAKKKV